MTDDKPMIRIIRVNKLRGEARKGVVYVGRAFAGWPQHALHNPFPARILDPRGPPLERYKQMLLVRPQWFREQIDRLWDETQHGVLPLGCWCVDATVGDGQREVCHAQILGQLLHTIFVAGKG